MKKSLVLKTRFGYPSVNTTYAYFNYGASGEFLWNFGTRKKAELCLYLNLIGNKIILLTKVIRNKN